jgi:hypothetical protein
MPPYQPRVRLVASAAWWGVPVFFLFWLYRGGFSTWFLADDFAWLSLVHRVQIRHDLLYELFAPMAQGTIRPWSERGFFILLQTLFGLNSLPFRVVVFATAALDVVLIAWVARRVTRRVTRGATSRVTDGSRIAGLLAAILWSANTALVRAMTWSSAYNEVMCPLFLLSALVLFIRYIETGRRAFWWWQVVVFSLGFGALEINIVYPAIAAAWVIFVAYPTPRGPLLRSVAPLAAISVAYFALHRLVAPLPASGAYALRFDGSALKTAALYWKWSLVPEPMERFGHSHFAAGLVFLIGSAAIIGFVGAELLRRRFTVLFCLAWFAVTLAPVLPLPDHRTDYYLTIPVIGIAMLGGVAAGRFWDGTSLERALLAIPVAIYLWAMIPVTQAVTQWWRVKSLSVRALVLGVEAARATHPGKAIVLDGVTTDLYNLSFAHSPFAGTGIDDVYLTPESALTIRPDPGMASLEQLVPEPEALWHGITHNDVVVYSVQSDRLRNITEGYTRRLAGRISDRLPSRVDVGDFLYSWLLGPTWLAPESGIRWMPGFATVRIGVPAGGTRLELEGRCPELQLLVAPRHLIVLVDGQVAADTRIYVPESRFRRLFPMPAFLAGKKTVELEIRVDPVDRKDGQDYGLVFGEIAIRP